MCHKSIILDGISHGSSLETEYGETHSEFKGINRVENLTPAQIIELDEYRLNRGNTP